MQMLSNEYRINEPRHSFRKTLSLIFALAVVVGAAMVIYYYTKVNRPATTESHEVKFVITKGLSTKQIAAELHDQKIISSEFIFLTYTKLHNAAGKIQAGDYALNSNMNVPEVIDLLTH